MKYFLALILLSASNLVFSNPVQFDENFKSNMCAHDLCVYDEVSIPLTTYTGSIPGTIVDISRDGTFKILLPAGHSLAYLVKQSYEVKIAGNKRKFNPYGAEIVNFKLSTPTQVTTQEKPLIPVDKYCGQIGKGWSGIVCALCAKETDPLDDRIVGLRSMILGGDWSLSEDERQMTIPILDDQSLKEIRCQVRSGNIPFSINPRVQDAILEILNKAGGFTSPPRNAKEI